MEHVAPVLQGAAAILWVVLATVALVFVWRLFKANGYRLASLSLSTTGISFEFANNKLDEAAQRSGGGEPATPQMRQSVIERLAARRSLLARARILWVDDHPENNAPIAELLTSYGAHIDTARDNKTALQLLGANAYQAVISDVGRDHEPGMPGIDLADEVFRRNGMRVILFVGRFDPFRVPNLTDGQRLALLAKMRECVFAWTSNAENLIHYILDVLERD